MRGVTDPTRTIDWPGLSRRTPALAGSLAYRRFCTPALSERRTADHDLLVARSRRHLESARHLVVAAPDGPTLVYLLEPERDAQPLGTVVLIHGWTSEASFMSALAEPLRRSGFRTVLFDCPAHGRSPGNHVSLIGFARSFLAVLETLSGMGWRADACVAHSMGCLAALLAAVGGRPFSRDHPLASYVLISSPNWFGDVTGDFAARLGLSANARGYFERHVTRTANRPLSRFKASQYLAQIEKPALLHHCRDDMDIPVGDSIAIAEACPQASLHLYEGIGHRRILHAAPVIRSTVKFLKEQSAP